jgi:hypothetical protein
MEIVIDKVEQEDDHEARTAPLTHGGTSTGDLNANVPELQEPEQEPELEPDTLERLPTPPPLVAVADN